ncbi:MAG: GntR family transcriptional regulator [Streptosporangiaceae bacterium]
MTSSTPGAAAQVNLVGPSPQLASTLRGQIKSGELPPGWVMPSEATLMQEHGLARGTVRKAVDALVEEGLVNRVQGRGTFVRR